MYLCDENGKPFNAETFDYEAYLAEAVPDPRMLEYPQGRRALTKYDPLLFSVIYGHMLIKDTDGQISFGDLHLDLCRKAMEWTLPLGPAESRHVFVAGRGNGKALAVDTPIPTPNGWTTMGDLKVGDYVFDKDGNPTRVVRATDVMYDHQCYKITFSDGSEIVADAEHNWWVKDRRTGRFHTRTTEELAPDFETFSSTGKRDRNYSIPVAGAVQYPKKYFTIHPYVLGAWLGDGHGVSGRITCGKNDVDEMEQKLRECGESPNRHHDTSGNFTLQMVRRNPHQCIRGHNLSDRAGKGKPCRVCIAQWKKDKSRRDRGAEPAPMSPIINETMIVRLRELGVLNNKHIPREYLQASEEQRMELLRGLMDTDGSISKSGSMTYTGTNKHLVEGVLELVLSLGIRAKMSVGKSKLNGKVYGDSYTVHFTTTKRVFNLTRKVERIRKRSSGLEMSRTIVNIEKTDSVPVRCIQVDNREHLFQCGVNHITTKNSTWTFKLLPMWAACHGHRKFVAAFSDSATQAQKHLMGWKNLMDASPLLREDYPDVCEPKRRPNGNAVADNQELYEAKSGFTFSAKGIDTGVLGLTNSENVRPDCLLLDDIEKDEANYSLYQAQQRLTTVLDTILPMNPRAALFFVGTVTMPGSIVHELVKSKVYNDNPPTWIKSNKFRVHYIKPIEKRPDGTERSTWPQVFPLKFFKDMEHTREYKKNYLNLPVSEGDEFWDESDFIYESLPDATRVLLQIDPAVTSRRTSDFTAFAVIAYRPARRETINGELVVEKAKCEVRDIVSVKKPPEELRRIALRLISKYPEIGAIRIEVNQGGDTWRSIFHDMPVKVLVHRESVPKKVRAQNLLNHYQRGRVMHRVPFRDLEDQMKSFPNVHHDDLIDAVGAGVHFFFKKRPKLEAKTVNYLDR